MTTHSEQVEQRGGETWEEDFASPSCVADFVWPEGAELRGNINLVDEQMIDRVEVESEWTRLKTKLLKKLA